MTEDERALLLALSDAFLEANGDGALRRSLEDLGKQVEKLAMKVRASQAAKVKLPTLQAVSAGDWSNPA